MVGALNYYGLWTFDCGLFDFMLVKYALNLRESMQWI